MSVLTLWRHTRLPLRCLSFVLPVCRKRIISLEMVILDTLKWSATAWWVIPFWTMSTARSWSFWRSIQNFIMANCLALLTAQLMTAGDLNAWFKLDHGTENWLYGIFPLQNRMLLFVLWWWTRFMQTLM
jgi:hypothetical protein